MAFTSILSAGVVVGCAVAVLLEASGFGAPRGGARAPYLAALLIAAMVAAATPAAVARWVTHTPARESVLWLAGSLALAVAIMGLTLGQG